LNVVGDQADDHKGRPVQGRQPFGSQDDLVQTVAADAAIQDGAAGQPLQLRGSGVEVADVLAVGEGIADRQYGRIGRRRLHARKPESIRFDRDRTAIPHGPANSGARDVTEVAIMDMEKFVGHGSISNSAGILG
jgi:hypothetical protein